MYIGAQVSLIKYQVDFNDKQQSPELVLARGMVTQPFHDKEDRNSESYVGTLPSATMHLPTAFDNRSLKNLARGRKLIVKDGYYILRVQFYIDDYFNENKKLNDKIPEAIQSGRLKFEQNQTSPLTNKENQDVYTYELNEKVTFKTIGGFGKLAIVCGDLITLEECLLYQFPQALPSSYMDFMTKSAKPEALTGTGVNSLGLAAAVKKNTVGLAEGFMHGGNPLAGGLQDTMFSVSKGIWSDIEQKMLPPAITSAAAFAFALTAIKEQKDAFNKSVQFAQSGKTVLEMAKIGFRKSIIDLPYLKEVFNTARQNSFSHNANRLGVLWFSDKLSKVATKALPIIDGAANLYELYELYEKKGELEKKFLKDQHDFDTISESYLQTISVVKVYHDWTTSIKQVQEAFNYTEGQKDTEGKKLAQIISDGLGLTIHINFKFNKWEYGDGNKSKEYYTDLWGVCEKINGLMIKNPSYKLIIDGHACRIGTQEANEKVAAERARTVTGLIMAPYPDTDPDPTLHERIVTNSYGNRRPMSADEIQSDMSQTGDMVPAAMNRRVEVRLIIPNYDVALPASRSGMTALETSRQIQLSNAVEKDDIESEQIKAVLSIVNSALLFSPLAPVAAGIILLKTGAEAADLLFSFIDECITEKVYSDFKARCSNVSALTQLDKMHKKILEAYRKINKEIERKELKTTEEVTQHLKDANTVKELQKRYLLRALALNGLVELLARTSLFNQEKTDRAEVLEEYKVREFIVTYIINDNWDVPSSTYNTMAQNWIQRQNGIKRRKNQVKVANAQAARNSAREHRSDKGLSKLAKRAQIHGEFNKGFPIQARLYQNDLASGFDDFAKMFDNNIETLQPSHIGFSRLLINVDNDDNRWVPLIDWVKKDRSNRITPFTRVKLQLILKKSEAQKKKKLFKAQVEYRCDRLFFDSDGPQFEVLMAPREMDYFTLSDGRLKRYFDSNSIDGYVTACEFEPTYWFGEYEIPGLKPLFGANPWTSFEDWKKNGQARMMRYYFVISGKTLDLSGRVYNKRTESFIYGVDDNNTLGSQCRINEEGKIEIDGNQFALYDGLANRKVLLNEHDLLIQEFVESTSAKEHSGIPKYLKGDVKSFFAAGDGNRFDWFEKSAPESSILEWTNNKPKAVYVALLSEGNEKENYAKMLPNDIPMLLTLSIEEQDSFFKNESAVGPSFLSELKEIGEFSFKQYPNRSGAAIITDVKFAFNKSEADQEVELAKDIKLFAESFVNKVEKKPQGYLKANGVKKTLYILKFELTYTSPTGSRIRGLRPFGPIIDKDKGEIFPTELTISSLSQVGLEPSVGKYDIKGEPKLALKGNKSYQSTALPWMKITHDISKVNISAHNYWNSELNDKPKERKAWLEEWITDSPTILTAPEPKGV
ncbi:OmpA family protein [Vibrio azureus]|nr:OmpA family protein [Vibrio azureus]